MSSKLYELRQMVGRLTSSMKMGTPSGGFGLGTFQSVTLADIYSNGYFNDWWIRFYRGTHRDRSARVMNFVAINGVINFRPNLPTNVDATCLFELHKDFTIEEINDAINLSISMVEDEALQDRVDESLIVIANRHEYVIPSGFLFIDRIFQEGDPANLYPPDGMINSAHWQILRGATPRIWFDNNLVALTTGKRLRIVGQSAQRQLTLDADICQVNATFLVYQAKALLHQSRIRGEGADFQEHKSQLAMAQSLADRERRRLFVSPRGRRIIH
ncbi:MAG: hypothetical protein DDT29_01525 [Dehalococcoidia bacterium]|nr:hypothetical protein [Bacillota bacterium]